MKRRNTADGRSMAAAVIITAAVFCLTTCDDFALKQTIDDLVLGWSRAVNLTAPANAERRVDKTPLLDWEDAGGATSYQLQIVESADQLESAEIISCEKSEYEIPDPLVFSDERFWRVRAVKEGEADPGPWSETWSFKIVISQSPLLLGEVSTGGNPYKMALQDNYVYVPMMDFAGVKIIDISEPSSPVIVATIDETVRDLTVKDNYLYTINTGVGPEELHIWDISNPASPVSKGSCPFSDSGNDYNAVDCVCSGGPVRTVVRRGSNPVIEWGEMDIDVTDPNAPFVEGFDPITPNTDPWYCVSQIGGIIITTDDGVFSWSSSKGTLAHYAVSNMGESFISSQDNYVFASSANGPLIILDISDPSDLTLVSEYDPDMSTAYTAARSDYLFTTTYPDFNLHIVDISDISSPILYSKKQDLPVSEIIDNYAYGLDYEGGKFVVTDLVPGD